jgi:hypothetical protein
MVAMKKTLLEIVQDIVNDLDSDSINSITDTEESEQVTDVVIQTYFDLISDRVIPEHHKLFRLTAVADSTRPTHLLLPEEVSTLLTFKYNKSVDGDIEYQKVHYRDPDTFMDLLTKRDSSSSSITTAVSIEESIELLVYNDRMPNFYTSLDNDYIVCDAHDSAFDSTLQASKTLCYGEIIPQVTRGDTFIFDFEAKYFPYLQAEAKSRCFANLHKTINQKTEQNAKRKKNFIQKEKWRLGEPNRRRNYGRT